MDSLCRREKIKISLYIWTVWSCSALSAGLSYFFPKRQILDSPKPKEFADDNFKFDENGRNFLNRVENTVGKGEIARYEQFLLFPQCFQKACTTDTLKTRACLGKG